MAYTSPIKDTEFQKGLSIHMAGISNGAVLQRSENGTCGFSISGLTEVC